MNNPQQEVAELLKAELTPTEPVEKQEQPDTLDESLEVKDESDESQPDTSLESDESQQEEEEAVDTLNNLAEELGVDVGDLYALNLKMPNGEPVQLGQLKDFYESNQDIEAQRQAVKNREAELQAESDKLREIPRVSNELVQAQARVMAIQTQWENTDWNTLRQQNPAEYAALQADYRNQFDMAKSNLATANDTVETHKSEARRHQQDRLFEAMPELKDDKVREQAAEQAMAFASKYGFSRNDVANIDDHRLMKLLIEASRVNKAVDTVKDKKVDATPQVLRPNAVRRTEPARKAALKRLTEKARASGLTEDKTAAVAALLK